MTVDLTTVPLDEEGIGRLETVDDRQLVSAVADALSIPRTAENSFTLHAPLELLARQELLPTVTSDHRDRARLQLVSLAHRFLRSGRPVPEPSGAGPDDTSAALVELVGAIRAADQERADSAAVRLATDGSASAVAERLAGLLLEEMGAAGHAPILLASYLRLPQADVRPLRGTARSLAERADLQMGPEWYRRADRVAATPIDLNHSLTSLRARRTPGFGIFRMVSAAHRDRVIEGIPRVAEDDRHEAFRVLWRIAARSMIEDDPDHAPYGWSHALTMPLGLYQTAHLHGRTEDALDIATLLLAGFRHAHGAIELPEDAPESGPEIDEDDLASAACIGEDAHLVKYVLACRHAARLDSEHRALYQQAAARLVDWWGANPNGNNLISLARTAVRGVFRRRAG